MYWVANIFSIIIHHDHIISIIRCVIFGSLFDFGHCWFHYISKFRIKLDTPFVILPRHTRGYSADHTSRILSEACLSTYYWLIILLLAWLPSCFSSCFLLWLWTFFVQRKAVTNVGFAPKAIKAFIQSGASVSPVVWYFWLHKFCPVGQRGQHRVVDAIGRHSLASHRTRVARVCASSIIHVSRSSPDHQRTYICSLKGNRVGCRHE